MLGIGVLVFWRNEADARGRLFHECRQELDNEYIKYLFLVADGSYHFQSQFHNVWLIRLNRISEDKALSFMYGDANVLERERVTAKCFLESIHTYHKLSPVVKAGKRKGFFLRKRRNTSRRSS